MLKNRLILCTIFVVLGVCAPITFAQYQPGVKYHIEYLTSDEGLSQNTVDCILKDSRGFMWFGTWNGLNRYDGYEFIIYKKEEGLNSLSNNFIYSLGEDPEGNIWIGTKNGLNLYIFQDDRFVHFSNEPDDRNSLSGNWITSLVTAPDGMIWAGTQNAGLNRIKYFSNCDSISVTRIKSGDGERELLSNKVRHLLLDSRNRLWIATDMGLNMMENGTSGFKAFRHNPEDPESLSFSDIRCMYEDRSGQIWVGTRFGLNRWVEGTNRFIRYSSDNDDPASLSHFVINDIHEDPEGQLYIATLGGIDLYNPQSDDFMHIPVYEKDNFSLNNEFINSVFCDESGLVWIGTEKGGVNKLNIYQKQFRHLSADPGDELELSHNTVNSILDEKDFLWVGTAGGGLNVVNKNTGEVKIFRYEPHRDESLTSDFVTSILRDRRGNIWIGTWGGGFDLMLSSHGKGQFRHHHHSDSDTNTLVRDFVSALHEDHLGRLWIGTEGGLDIFEPETGTYTHVCNRPPEGEPLSEVGCILGDSRNEIWVGTRNGLYHFPAATLDNILNEPNTGIVYRYRNNPDDTTTISENYVISLHEDALGRIWAGTYGNGLNLVKNHEAGGAEFLSFTTREGLSNNIIYGILEDNAGNLWLSTDHGLSKFNIHAENFRNYYRTDGLQSNQFYWSACYPGVDGQLYFGGTRGLNYFFPEQIRDNQIQPRPVLTEFKLFNTPVSADPSNRKAILRRVISVTDNIELNYRQNTFSLEFSGLSFDLPEKNTYKYMLSGVDNDWITVNADRRFANYTKLPGGEYTFRLMAANSDGLWNDDILELDIVITPPFWQTIWFRALLVGFILALIFAYLKLHTRSLQLQKKKLAAQVKERTSQIEEQKNLLQEQAERLQHQNEQLEKKREQIEGQKVKLENQNTEILQQRDKLIDLNKKVKAVNQLKLKFFTNVSHEFRTPLTLILGPLERLLQSTGLGPDERSLLELMKRNAGRLMHLINELMDFRKIEQGKMKLRIQKSDLSRFIAAIAESFRDLAAEKKITIYADLPDSATETWFDKAKMENIVYNLLSNAFKYTPEKGTIWLRGNIVADHKEKAGVQAVNGSGPTSTYRLSVSDSGIGIHPDDLPNIFKRFFRADHEVNGATGSGIGLSLTHELVKLHHGKIHVSSEPGRGTEFVVEIPCSRSGYREEEIDRDPDFQSQIPGRMEKLRQTIQPNSLIHNNEEHAISHLNRPAVLVVEDNYELQQFVAGKLNLQYNILVADNGKTALEIARKENPSLIISDIMMPGMNGLELCKVLKEDLDTSHIPVILLTAKGSDENRITGFKTGADDYIPKPFSMEVLEVRVTNLIDSRRKLRKLFSSTAAIQTDRLTSTPADKDFLNRAIKLVEEHIDNANFDVHKFAEGMCVSRSLLHRKLSALTDKSATDFINTIRLRRSQQLMRNGVKNISEVAYAVGYNDPKYFSRLFRKHFGKAPTAYIGKKDRQVG